MDSLYTYSYIYIYICEPNCNTINSVVYMLMSSIGQMVTLSIDLGHHPDLATRRPIQVPPKCHRTVLKGHTARAGSNHQIASFIQLGCRRNGAVRCVGASPLSTADDDETERHGTGAGGSSAPSWRLR